MSWLRLLRLSAITGLFFLITITLLIGTPLGNRAMINLLSTMDNLDISYESGTINQNLQLKSLTFSSKNLSVQLSNIAISVKFSCLAKLTLCIDQFSVKDATADISKPVSNETKTEQSQAFTGLPMAFQINELKLGTFNVTLDNQQFSGNELAISVSAKHRLISVDTFALNDFSFQKLDKHPAKSKPKEKGNIKTLSTKWLKEINQTLQNISLPLDINLKKIAVNSIQLTPADSVITLKKLKLSSSWLNNRLNIGQLSLIAPQYGRIKMEGFTEFQPKFNTELFINTEIEQFKQLPELAGSTQTLAISGNLPKLKLSIQSQGNVKFETDATVNITNTDLPFSLSFTGEKIPTLVVKSYPISIEQLALKAEGTIKQQKVTMNSQLTGAGYQQAQVTLQANHANNTLQLKQLQIAEPLKNSELLVTGEISYQPEIEWQLAVQAQKFQLPLIQKNTSEMPLPSKISGTASISGEFSDGWHIAIENTDLVGNINNEPFQLSGAAELNNNGVLKPSNLLVQYQSASLKLSGNSDQQWHINGKLEIPKLVKLSNQLQGNVTADISILGPIASPVLTINGQGKNININQFSVPLAHFEAKTELTKLNQSHFSLNAAQLFVNDIQAEHFELAITGDRKTQKTSVNWQGESTLSFQGESQLSDDFKSANVTISALQFTYHDLFLKPDHAISLSLDENAQSVAFSSHCWLSNGASLCFEKPQTLAETGELNAKIQLDGGLVSKSLLPETLQLLGDYSGNIWVKWQQLNFNNATVDLTASEGSFRTLLSGTQEKNSYDDPLYQESATWNWQQANIHANITDEIITSTLDIKRKNNKPFVFIDSTINLAKQRTINANVQFEHVNLSPLAGFISRVHTLNGFANGDLSIEGSFKKPKIVGDVTLKDVTPILVAIPSTITKGQFAVKFSGYNSQFSGGINVDDQPTVLSGNASWKDNFELDTTLKSNQLNLNIPPKMVLSVAPNISLHWRDNLASLVGDIHVLSGDILVDSLPASGVPISDDVVLVNEQGQIIKKKSNVSLSTNINIKIDDKLQVQGNGFKSNVTGDLSLKQLPFKPLQLYGTLTLLDGKYRAYGQDLTIDEGDVYFNGPTNNPTLEVSAVRKISDEQVVVGLNVNGEAKALKVTLFSDPVMEQNEIMSYLLRGRGFDADTSSGTATGIALGVGLTNASGLLKKLDKIPLLNHVEVDTQGQGVDTQATISGYIGDKVYLKYGVGVFMPVNELTVRLYLMNKLWLETVSSLESSIDLYYSFDVN